VLEHSEYSGELAEVYGGRLSQVHVLGMLVREAGSDGQQMWTTPVRVPPEPGKARLYGRWISSMEAERIEKAMTEVGVIRA
jgi:hypothetical protein